MDMLLTSLDAAFGRVAESSPVFVLLPLVVIGVAQGLRAEGVRDVVSETTAGLIFFAVAIFLLGGLRSTSRFDLDAWGMRLDGAWDELLGLTLFQTLGYWLLILAIISLVFVVKSVTRR